MTKEDLISLLKEDLTNEYNHMLFYLAAGVNVQGPHREELGEFFAKEARDEMNHIEQFSKVIIDLGGVPEFSMLSYPDQSELEKPEVILQHVFDMETKVVERYVQRMEDAMTLGGVDGRYIEIFLEEQILDSRQTAAHVKEMLKGF